MKSPPRSPAPPRSPSRFPAPVPDPLYPRRGTVSITPAHSNNPFSAPCANSKPPRSFPRFLQIMRAAERTRQGAREVEVAGA